MSGDNYMNPEELKAWLESLAESTDGGDMGGEHPPIFVFPWDADFELSWDGDAEPKNFPQREDAGENTPVAGSGANSAVQLPPIERPDPFDPALWEEADARKRQLHHFLGLFLFNVLNLDMGEETYFHAQNAWNMMDAGEKLDHNYIQLFLIYSQRDMAVEYVHGQVYRAIVERTNDRIRSAYLED